MARGRESSVDQSGGRPGHSLSGPRSAQDRPGSVEGSTIYMSSTEAQNGFGRVLDSVAHNHTVLITKHNTTQAVVMSLARYEALTRSVSSELDTLTAEFDEILERLQTPEARAGLRDAFTMSPDELGRVAVAAARQHAE